MLLADEYGWPPNYTQVFVWRQQRILNARKNRVLFVGAKEYYRTRPAEFIDHWCDTYDPRNLPLGLPARVPFVLFPRQVKLIEFFHACLKAEECGLVEKSRDMGATWLASGFSVWLWLFWPGAAVGWGSYKEQLVDRIGVVDSIFEKMRMIVRGLPDEFLPNGFNPTEHMTYMRFVNPENGATITGEVGDNMGRGGRKMIYFKDESAHYEHPEMIEAALTDNTRVQIDLSSVHGLGTVFHRKREAGVDWEPGNAITKGRTNVFVMDWSDHPAKTQAWHDERERSARDNGLMHVFAQEVDRNYAASVEGVIIKPEWVTAAIDAHLKLSVEQSGMWVAALDVADEGLDTNALAKRKGCVLKGLDEWGDRDVGASARRAIAACRDVGSISLQYDCVGVGAGVKSEGNRLIEEKLMPKGVTLVPWSAAAKVKDEDKRLILGDANSPLNKDYFYNYKAQAWVHLARRFENTYRALHEKGFTWKADELISLPSDLPLLRKLQKELSQATASIDNARMKLVVDKAPDGSKSPNLADAVVMAFFPVLPGYPSDLDWIGDPTPRQQARMSA